MPWKSWPFIQLSSRTKLVTSRRRAGSRHSAVPNKICYSHAQQGIIEYKCTESTGVPNSMLKWHLTYLKGWSLAQFASIALVQAELDYLLLFLKCTIERFYSTDREITIECSKALCSKNGALPHAKVLRNFEESDETLLSKTSFTNNVMSNMLRNT